MAVSEIGGMDLEALARVPRPLDASAFNPLATLPYGLAIDHIAGAMRDRRSSGGR